MKKLRLFLENFLVYGVGGVISKLVPLIMVPIVTRLMPDTTYYGLSDMSNTIISFASAFAIMGMYDSMYRLFFEKEDDEYKKEICSTALVFTLCTSFAVFVAMLLAKEKIASRFLGGSQNVSLVYILAIATLAGATNNIIAAPTRMQNKRKVFLVTNMLSPMLAYGIAILLLLSGHYVTALPLAMAIAAVVMEVSFGIMNRKWFCLRRIRVSHLKPLLSIALPLLPNFLVYWIFNSCDRLMITELLGLAAVGVYSVGSKLGHASQLIYTAFAGGWQYFAFSTMKEKDQVKTNTLVFEYLGLVSFATSAFVCAWSHPIFKLLFTGEYVKGHIVAPYLFLAPLLQMLFQVAGNQFLVIRKTWPNILILSAGAVLNICLNLWLIPVIGIEGASIATLAGYIVSDTICVMVLQNMKLMQISERFVAASGCMIVYFFVWRLWFSSHVIMGTMSAAALTGILCWLYRHDIQSMWKMIKNEKSADIKREKTGEPRQ